MSVLDRTNLPWTKRSGLFASNAVQVIVIDEPEHDDERMAALEELLLHSLSDDGFDWGVLGRINQEGWGLEDDQKDG